ncbi:hypothetical protein BT93_C0255 [Corymbia citriodora subsp. variegata]|nr:hypothetical protein BT93_C0255 [Corymbia citriodora subsp. variegata]
MASSSSLKCKRNYDIFLSFRGIDIRKNFLSHLYTALDQNGLFTFIDSEELRKGEQISSTLMKAIEESQLAISFSLRTMLPRHEVVKIIECKARKDLVVLPVFYKVEPREVREGRESYGKAMAKHESKFGKNSEKVNRWKEALFAASSLSGWDLNDGDEAQLIKRMVKEISSKLDRTPLHVARHLVGIHLRVAKLKSMLNLKSHDDVLMIGLWGQGGIGKTTLAVALYNALFRKFEGSCVLENVRETSRESKHLVSLQERKRIALTTVREGINSMQYRLCCKKVLIVLDDVNDIEQLNALAGDCEWFGKGSRIIITTRDSHLLTSHGIDKDHIYEVQTLEYCEALELFKKYAFVRNNKIVIQGDLVDSALQYAKGSPLALKVLGSFLCGRREQEWKSALDQLAKSPNKTINDVLNLSYDGLEDYQKEIFLDIAYFFKGKYIEYIEKVLDSCGFNVTIGVQVLVEKSLIIEEYGKLQMHDLIQLMGMDIVKQECRDDPARRSRLWLFDDVRDVLSGDMVRFVDPIYLPNGLRWFDWPKSPWFPKFSSGPKKLVGLYMQGSNIKEVGGQFKCVMVQEPKEIRGAFDAQL